MKYQDCLYGLNDDLVARIFDADAPFAEIVTITPEMAEHWIGANINNRRKKAHQIAMIANDICRGEWMLTGETIVFSDDGRLLDGQNRLLACIQAGQSITSFVAYGIAPEAFFRMDRTTRRQVADTLYVKDVGDAVAAAAIARFLFGADNYGLERVVNRIARSHLTPDSVYEAYYFEHQDEIAQALVYGRKVRALISRTVGGGLFALCARKSAYDAELFFEALGTGTNLSERSPIYRLRERLLFMRADNIQRYSINIEVVTLIIYAWNLYREGREVRALQTGKLKQFPEIK